MLTKEYNNLERVLFLIYNFFLCLFAIAAIPFFLTKIGKYRKSIKQKLGFFTESLFYGCTGRPRIWMNAVSVGEVSAVSPIVRELKKKYPSSSIIISTGTETGQKVARQLIESASGFFYFPLDFPWIVRKVIDMAEPDVFITAETEIWPNFLCCMKKKGARIMLVNGRISVRSFKNYYRFRVFFRKVMDYFDCIAVASQTDAERMRLVGAPRERIFVTGNSKFDALLGGLMPGYEEEMRNLFEISEGKEVFIAASTHSGEEEIILDAYSRLLEEFPELLLIIVPRHVERTPEIERLLRMRGFNSYFLRTMAESGEKRSGRNIIIENVTGELFKLYSVATIAFCGGSLVRKGGQNILEPAAWGKVVLYGPSMEDFQEAKRLLEDAGAGYQVRNSDEIFSLARRFLRDPDKRKTLGEAGKKVILENSGAASRTAELAGKLLRPESKTI